MVFNLTKKNANCDLIIIQIGTNLLDIPVFRHRFKIVACVYQHQIIIRSAINSIEPNFNIRIPDIGWSQDVSEQADNLKDMTPGNVWQFEAVHHPLHTHTFKLCAIGVYAMPHPSLLRLEHSQVHSSHIINTSHMFKALNGTRKLNGFTG